MSESHLHDGEGSNGATHDVRVQELLRKNQDLQARLADTEGELAALRLNFQQLAGKA